MASVGGRYCIDRFEAATVEVLPGNRIRHHSPYEPVDGLVVRAVSRRGVIPQAYISRDEAEAACENAGKRLCTDEEWVTACKGKHPSQFPYGDVRKDGFCNDSGISSFNWYYGPGNGDPPGQEAYTWANLNDPRLNQRKSTVAPSGSFRKCRSSFDAYDLVGNLHEWTASKSGTFRGGYYLDTHINGDGCDYRTTAHAPSYHDYSTGFRCCR
jgi:formylglycine-generating enzyme required for sulfatase activity